MATFTEDFDDSNQSMDNWVGDIGTWKLDEGGGFSINSNQAAVDTAVNCSQYVETVFQGDVDAFVTIDVERRQVGVSVRRRTTDVTDHYKIQTNNGGTLSLQRIVNGAATSVSSGSAAIAGDEIGIGASGTGATVTVYGYLNNRTTADQSYGDTDTNRCTWDGYAGIYGKRTATRLNDFVVIDASTAESKVQITADIGGSGAASGALSRRHQITADIGGAAANSGPLVRKRQLTATIGATSAAGGTLDSLDRMTATAAGAAAAGGTLSVGRVKAVTATGQWDLTVAVSAPLTYGEQKEQITADIGGAADAGGGIQRVRSMTATAGGAGAAGGALSSYDRMTATIGGAGVAGGTLSRRRQLTVSAAFGLADAGGALTIQGDITEFLTATIGGAASAGGALDSYDRLTATFGGAGAAGGALQRIRSITATLNGGASATGALTVGEVIEALTAAIGGAAALSGPLGSYDRMTVTLAGAGVAGGGLQRVRLISGTVGGSTSVSVSLAGVTATVEYDQFELVRFKAGSPL